jgi:hypothetical protein
VPAPALSAPLAWSRGVPGLGVRGIILGVPEAARERGSGGSAVLGSGAFIVSGRTFDFEPGLSDPVLESTVGGVGRRERASSNSAGEGSEAGRAGGSSSAVGSSAVDGGGVEGLGPESILESMTERR